MPRGVKISGLTLKALLAAAFLIFFGGNLYWMISCDLSRMMFRRARLRANAPEIMIEVTLYLDLGFQRTIVDNL